MRVAALYDIHGNIDALDAVIGELGGESVDHLVLGGDLVWGPFPTEVMERIRALELPVNAIRGNADREVAARADESDGLERWVAMVNTWCADQLSEDDRGFLATLPGTISLTIEGLGEVLFCHGTPQSDEAIVTEITPDGDVGTILAGVSQETIVCGHTHVQFDRRLESRRLVNAGSVGLPNEDRPGAYWALLGPDVELRCTEYDTAQTAARIRQSNCPDATGFAESVISPMSRREATATFEERRSERAG